MLDFIIEIFYTFALYHISRKCLSTAHIKRIVVIQLNGSTPFMDYVTFIQLIVKYSWHIFICVLKYNYYGIRCFNLMFVDGLCFYDVSITPAKF